MTKMKKWLANLLFGVLMILSICGFTACESSNTGAGANLNSIYGTYYHYEDGNLNKSFSFTFETNGVCYGTSRDGSKTYGTYEIDAQNFVSIVLDGKNGENSFEGVVSNGVLQLYDEEFFCKQGVTINEILGPYFTIDYLWYEQPYYIFYCNGIWRYIDSQYDSIENTYTDTVLCSGTYTIEKNGKYDISMDIDEEFKNFFPEGYEYYANYDNGAIVLYGEYYFDGEYSFGKVGEYAKDPSEFFENY